MEVVRAELVAGQTVRVSALEAGELADAASLSEASLVDGVEVLGACWAAVHWQLLEHAAQSASARRSTRTDCLRRQTIVAEHCVVSRPTSATNQSVDCLDTVVQVPQYEF